MKISEAIAKLQKVLDCEGDLEMFDSDGYNVMQLEAEDAAEFCFPADWNIPKRFLRVRLDN